MRTKKNTRPRKNQYESHEEKDGLINFFLMLQRCGKLCFEAIMTIKIDKFRQRIQNVCRDLELKSLDLVGSAAREDFAADSDVDVLVNFGNDRGLFGRYFDLKERLEEIFERPVDVIEERAVKNPYFKRAVERDRIKIYGT